MSMKWIAIGLSLCAAAQIALLIWGRHIKSDVLPRTSDCRCRRVDWARVRCCVPCT